MKLNSKDWQTLQTPLMMLMAVLLVLGMLFFFVDQFNTQQTNALQTQLTELNVASLRLKASGVEKNNIIEYLPKYQALINQGFIGEEHRIEWVEALKAQQKAHQLFTIEYAIGPQQDFKPNFASDIGNFSMHKSSMKINFDMLHEGDLLQLTESLNEKNLAAWMLRECVITRLNTASNPYQLHAKLHTQCEIDWITLREPTPTEPTTQ